MSVDQVETRSKVALGCFRVVTRRFGRYVQADLLQSHKQNSLTLAT
jgi:hypothetical protein